MGRWLPLACPALVAAAALTIGLGCRPQIGDSCKLSTDCSVTGDRLCDTSMPDGYCTIFNCDPNSCPDEATCVEFHSSSVRHTRRFCLLHCGSASDCRNGYVCAVLSRATDEGALTQQTIERDAKIVDSSPSKSGVCLP